MLAVASDPAEPRPGELTTFRSLIYVPGGMELEGVVWFACLPESATDFGCSSASDVEIDPENPDFEALVEAGFIGFEPAFPPAWTPPADALADLDEAQRTEGVSAIVNVTAIPAGVESAEDLDDSDVEIAYKRVPVSEATTPNHNPALSGIEVDGEPLEGALIAEPGGEYEIDPQLTDDSLEAYTYTNSDGESEEREEEPYFTWYTEAGSFDQPFSLHPYSSVTWTAPDEAFEGLILVVVRDRRGGMAWQSVPVRVEEP